MHAPAERPRRSFWSATRRTLLIGGTATVGLAIGWAAWPRERRHNLAAREGTEIMNAWLRVGTDGRIIVICPQAEIGQGTHTGMAQLLADELGADWRTVEVEPAPLNPVYANRGLTADMTAELPGTLRPIANWVAAEAMTRMDAQLTGGSTSIRGFDQELREAGAAARSMLQMAAARQWDMDWTQCRTGEGFVTGGANRGSFAEFAAAAAQETPPAELELRPLRAVGRSRPRLDVPAKVDGSATFGLDVRLPGMVYAAVRHGPAGDRGLPQLAPGVPAGALAVTRGPGWAAVVADRWYAANAAAVALEPKFAATAGLADSATMDAALAAAANAGATLAGEGRLIEARMSVPFAIHAALEPMNATARITGDRVEIWAPTQSTRLTAHAVATALGLPDTAVTVYPTLAGGGFGRKAETDAAVEAALIARDVKRPVQLIWSREEDTRASPMRPATHARYQARLGPDGAILALHARVANQSATQSFSLRNAPGIAFGVGDPDPASLEGIGNLPYAVGKIEAEHAPMQFPVPVGFWRSVSNSYTAFFNEVFIDDLARAARMDPLAYRLKLLVNAPRHRHVLATVAERAGYGPGMGVALHQSFGSIVAVVAEAAVEPEPRISRITIGIDCGRAINPDLVRQQMEGSVVWALTAALKARATFKDGYCEQSNFADYPLLTLAETPSIDVLILTNLAHPVGGVGEPGVPPVAPAVANAFAALTAKPLHHLPLEIA